MPDDSNALENYLQQQQELFGNTLYLPPDQTPSPPEETAGFSRSEQLAAFKSEIKNCQNCALGQSRHNFVFGDGNPEAKIVFVGEAPGEQEDLQGVPFVGRAGKMLDKILAAINTDRQQILICNVLKCRPPRNRDPLAGEVEQCEPYLKKQLEIIRPKLIVALGRVAAKTLLRIEEPLGKMRNRLFHYHDIDMMVTYHPAALLRNSNLKKFAWEDFQRIRDEYLLKD